MITFRTEVKVKGISGDRVSEFMLNCSDEAYQRWWPGVHLAFHPIKARAGHTGSLVYFDEYIGTRRMRFAAVIAKYRPGEEIVWQMKKIFRLPAWLSLKFEDVCGGLRIIHELRLGFAGPGSILDPLMGLFLSREFKAAIEEHVISEFNRLADLLVSMT